MREHAIDETDAATEQAMMATDMLIKIARSQKPDAQPTGNCLNCWEPLADGLRWCNADCRDDYQKRSRA